MKIIQTVCAIFAQAGAIASTVRTSCAIFAQARPIASTVRAGGSLPGLLFSILFFVFVSLPAVDLSAEAIALDPERGLAKADSLFHAKQYTQSLEVYQGLYAQQLYSPAMLLKMAYIEEGLGHLAQTELYINRYYLATYDPLAQNKMEDLASKNRLEGYQNNDRLRIFSLAAEFYTPLLVAIASVCVFLVALSAFLKFKRQTRPTYIVYFLVGFLVLLGTHAWFSPPPRQAILAGTTYLMEGPSAGSKVVTIASEGHRVRVLDHQDVWARVEWGERIVFVRGVDLIAI